MFFTFEIIGKLSHFDRGISFGVRVFDYLRRQPPGTSPSRVVNIRNHSPDYSESDSVTYWQ